MLGDYETCFGISLDPKLIHWESKEAENHSIQDFFNNVKVLSFNLNQIHV